MRRLFLSLSSVFVLIGGWGCKARPPESNSRIKGLSPDWAAEQAEREKAIDQYKARRPESWDWFFDRPVGFNGVPLVLLRAMIEYFPDVWKPEGNLDALGFPPRPGDYKKDGTLRDVRERQGLPYGFSFASSPYETNPKLQTLNVFFPCGGCHMGRVIVDGKVKYIPGGPNTEVEPQGYPVFLKNTAKKFVFNFSPDPKKSLPDAARLSAFYSYLVKLRDDLLAGKIKANFFFGGLVYEKKTYNGKLLDETYYKELALAELDKVLVQESYFELMKRFASGLVKVDIMYEKLARTLNYVEKNGKKPPPLNLPKPGQMDPWGIVQGNIALNAVRPTASGQIPWLAFVDKFYAGRPQHDLFFAGNNETDPKVRYLTAVKSIVGNVGGLIDGVEQTPEQTGQDIATAAKWYSNVPSNIDIRPIWMAKDQYWANWDGNQAASARTLASGVSAVGDPRQVDVNLHSAMNPFTDDLPATPYPFDVNLELAKEGKAIFDSKCESCHTNQQKKVFNIGTDENRLLSVGPKARAALVALTQEACFRDMQEYAGKTRRIDDFDVPNGWCASKDSSGKDRDLYVDIDIATKTREDGAKPLGYKAGPLHGLWALAPYLHNGSVPTLWHMLQPTENRPKTFHRGNINYDTKNVGFVWDSPATKDKYPAGELVHSALFDTSLNGNGNDGHQFGVNLPDEKKWALIEYLKTL